jgi:hypothetical protein
MDRQSTELKNDPPEYPSLVQHAEGGLYEVVGLAKGAGQSRDEPVIIVYRAISDGKLWYRTPEDFNKRFEEVKPLPVPSK